MATRYGFRFVALLLLAASAQIVHAQLPVIRSQQRLPLPPQNAPRPSPQGAFGELAVTDGRTILVTLDQGPAGYTYVKDATGRWIYDSALTVPDGIMAIGGAVRGNVAVLQGFFDFAPVVFVFLRSGGEWTHTQTLPGFQGTSRTNRVALGPDYLAIADVSANDFAGAVHIYDEASPGNYVFNTDLSATGAGQGFLLGEHVIADGDTVMASAAGGEMVVAFARTDGTWSEQGQLIPDRRLSGWFFGLSGNRAVLASPEDPQLFVRRDGAWLKRDQVHHPSDPQRQLLNPIALDGRRLILGEEGSEDALLFELHDGTWRATAVLRNGNDAACPRPAGSGTTSLVGTLALAACPLLPTPDHDFDGRVLVYELPPLQ